MNFFILFIMKDFPLFQKILKLSFILLLVSMGCNKKKGQSDLYLHEVSPIPEVIQAIDQVQRPGNIQVKKLSWEDVGKLNAIPAEKGGSFKAKEGDIYVETQKIRAVIQSPSREIGPFTYGGNLIDVDIKRGDGNFYDVLGEENLFVFLGHTLKPKKVGLFRDNVVVAYGELDILDFINAQGLVDILGRYVPGFSLPFKIDEVKTLRAEKYFVFSDDRWIKVIDVLCNTSDNEIPYFFFADLIDSGGYGEFFIPSSPLKGYGYSSPDLPFGLGLFQARFLSFVSEELDSSYGIFPSSEDNIALIVSGVAAIAYSILEKNDPISTLIGVIRGTSEKFITIKPKDCVYNEKYFIVGNSSLSSLTDEFFKLKGKKENLKVFSVSGRVKVGSSDILPGKVRISIFDQNKQIITSATSDIYGKFSVLLPEGKYTFVAEAKYSQISERIDVDVNSDKSDVLLTLKEPSKVSVEVVEVGSSEQNIPAKISFVCVAGCPKKYCIGQSCEFPSSSFRDVTLDPLPNDVQEVVFSANGKPVDVYIPAGKYKVVVSRGMEYSRDEIEIDLKPGESKSIKAYLYRVADAKGWMSADTHVHAVNSPDSPVSLVDRVITFAAEGVDVIISTDHDWLTDYEPAIKLVGIQNFLASLVGQEITTFSYGHFNSYPLKYDVKGPSGGAFDWAEKYDRFEKYGINQSEKENYRFLRSLHPREIFKGARLMKPDTFKRNVVQINHPRSGGMGYFDSIGLDTRSLKTSFDPCKHRIFPPAQRCGGATELGIDDTGLFVPLDILKDLNSLERFDAIEVYNSYSEITAVINDWFSFLNHGVHITAVGCSDTHKKISDISGIGRTFVWIGDKDDPESFRQSVDIQNTFVDNLADGKVFVSNGIILETFKICGFVGSSESCVEMGFSNIKRLSPPFRLILVVKSADWVDFDTIRIFTNSSGTAAQSGRKVVGFPKSVSELTISPSIKEIRIGDRSFNQKYFELDIPISPPQADFWVVSVVECQKCSGDKNPMFPVIPNKNVKPIMITNPIYVDFDGDGRFSPSSPTYAEKQAPILIKKERPLQEALEEIMKEHIH